MTQEESKVRVDVAIREVGLTHARNYFPEQLSGGIDAAADRDQRHQRVEAVAQIVLGQTAYGDVASSSADGLVREAERLLARGGERAPLLRDGLLTKSPALYVHSFKGPTVASVDEFAFPPTGATAKTATTVALIKRRMGIDRMITPLFSARKPLLPAERGQVTIAP